MTLGEVRLLLCSQNLTRVNGRDQMLYDRSTTRSVESSNSSQPYIIMAGIGGSCHVHAAATVLTARLDLDLFSRQQLLLR